LTPGSKRDGSPTSGHRGVPAKRHSGHPSGRHASAARKPARWARRAAPVAAIAATLAAGTTAYGLTNPHRSDPAKLSAALSAPMVIDAFTHSGVARTDADSGVVLPAHPASSKAAHSPSASATRRAARPTQSATATPAVTQGAAPQPSQSPTATATPTPAATPSPTPTATASNVSCSGNSYLLPQNVTAIVSFLLANGYSDNAAAGIAGNIYQESGGNPESVGSGGGGLIGFTPLPSGYVTGNPTADLQTQLNAILSYNQIWASYIPELNDASSPSDAADIYVYDFERAGIPAASNREASAEAVASACNL
jgi:hypothetical protein